MKKLSLTILLFILVVAIYAQPKIEFQSTTYDFGSIKEEGGQVTGRFEFTNVGDSALILISVRPGCGCTAANYTKTPVEPGQKGFIDATYNPYNRPGGFNKNIRVTTNEPKFQDPKAAPALIFIKGNVIKRPPTVFETAGYSIGSGMTRIKQTSKKMELYNTDARLDTFQFKNFWTQGVSIELPTLPAHISEVSRSFGNILEPLQEGIVVLKYDATKRDAFGTTTDIVTFITNDSIEPKKVVYYNVNIKENFSRLTEKDRKNAPVLTMDTSDVNFGNITINSTVNKTIAIKNSGKTPLLIRQTKSSTGALVIKTDKNRIEPNETINMTLTFNAKNRKGKQKATVDLITNDPNRSVIVINVAGDILQ